MKWLIYTSDDVRMLQYYFGGLTPKHLMRRNEKMNTLARDSREVFGTTLVDL